MYAYIVYICVYSVYMYVCTVYASVQVRVRPHGQSKPEGGIGRLIHPLVILYLYDCLGAKENRQACTFVSTYINTLVCVAACEIVKVITYRYV